MFEDLDLAFLDDAPPIEKAGTITPRMLRADLKRATLTMTKREHLSEMLTAKPPKGAAIHAISNGQYDFWTYVPVVLDLIGHADEFYGSTWTLNRANCEDMFRLYDEGRLGSIGFLTGTYFKRRESAVYATLMEGIQARGQRYVCLENHAKVVLLGNRASDDWLVIEGSANFTANPRIEQYCIVNDRSVYDFHRAWMEEALA